MSWFKVDDHLHSHRKAVRAGTEAMGLWILAGSWSAAEESDGWVPAYMLPRLAGHGADDLADALVATGLWHADSVDGEAGYRFHQWDEHQPTRAQLVQRREDNAARMRRARSQGGDVRKHDKHSVQPVREHSADTVDAVTPTRPGPSRPSKTTTAGAAEFDAFWTAYPRKEGKGAAAKAWTKATKATDPATVMAGLANAQQVWTTTGTEARFIPHPATWLNQGRWADEVPLPDMPEHRPATANQCDGTSCPGVRHEWTDARNRFMCMGVEA